MEHAGGSGNQQDLDWVNCSGRRAWSAGTFERVVFQHFPWLDSKGDGIDELPKRRTGHDSVGTPGVEYGKKRPLDG